MSPPRYININGITKLNPEYMKWKNGSKNEPIIQTNQNKPCLAITCNMEQYNDYNKLQIEAGKGNVKLADTTTSSLEILEIDDIKEEMGFKNNEWVDKLSKLFAEYEIPIGLLNK